jgi:hypothetical protein
VVTVVAIDHIESGCVLHLHKFPLLHADSLLGSLIFLFSFLSGSDSFFGTQYLRKLRVANCNVQIRRYFKKGFVKWQHAIKIKNNEIMRMKSSHGHGDALWDILRNRDKSGRKDYYRSR